MQNNSIKFSPIKDRILHFARLSGLSANKIYTKTGITRGVLRQSNGISEINLSKFLDTFPEVNPTWLVTGKGEIVVKSQQERSSDNPTVQELVERTNRLFVLYTRLAARLELITKDEVKISRNA